MAFRAFLQRLGYDVKRVPDQYFPSADGLTLASRATGGAEEPVATYGTPASPEVVLTRVTANRVHINHRLGMAVAYRAGQRLGQGLLRLAGLSVTLPPHHHAAPLMLRMTAMYTSAVTTHTAAAPGVRGSRFCPTCNTLKMIDSTNTMMKNHCCHLLAVGVERGIDGLCGVSAGLVEYGEEHAQAHVVAWRAGAE